MRRVLLFLGGVMSVVLSLTLSVTIFMSWVKLGLSNGVTVSVQSVAFATIWIGVICVVIGTIGGYLIGRYLEEFRLWLKDN
jgi:hydrogenase-4 membrane subunit HyfE